MTEKRIYFISELPPVNTHASSVIFYRHFKKFEEEGYKIIWVTDKNSFLKAKTKFPGNWRSILLPNRRWHLPPYKAEGLFQKYRFRYYLHVFLKREQLQIKSSVIISYINGQFLAPFAAYLSRELRIPMIGFFHDDILELNFFRDEITLRKNTTKVLNACRYVFAVSDEFKLTWPNHTDKFQLLYPIPEDYKISGIKRPNISEGMTFAYSGAVYDEIVPFLLLIAEMLNQLSYKLIIVGDKSKTGQIQKKFPETVTCFDLFDTPSEGNNFIAENADYGIIPYPDEIHKMPWISTCYPSKFIQYTQLHLPTIIIAPPSSAIGKWCRKHQWPLYLSDYDLNSFSALVRSTKSESVRKHMDYWRNSHFSPDEIHQKVRNVIWQLITPIS